MSVGGFFKGLGKVALKAAPIAASFIPGVGPLASLAIGAASGGADAAIHHKGVGGILGSAALGAGEGYGSSKLLGAAGVGGKSVGFSDKLPNIASTGFGGGGGGASSGIMGFLKSNPTLLLAAASLLGGNQTNQSKDMTRTGYHGDLINPKDTLYQALSGVYRGGAGLAEKPNTTLKGLLPQSPGPVNIPGLGVQIGGGMGHNPAQDDMEVDTSYLNKYDPFQGVAQNQFSAAAKKRPLV